MTMMAGVLVALMAAETAPDGPVPAAPAPQQVERGELVTDRPDFTESSLVVGDGIWQLETGLAYEGDEAGARGFAAPQALLRLGLSRRVELRLGASGFLAERTGSGFASTTGASDFEVGAKVTVFEEERHGIGVSLIPIVSLPVGSDAFSSGGVDPTLKITWARELPRGFGLSGNVNVMAETEGDEHVGRHAWSFSLGHDLAFGWGGYAEVYGFSSVERGGDAAWTLNGGLTRGIGGDRQFDLSVGRGLSDAAPNWFVSAGFSLRGAWRR
jgi:hypothetical protein